MKAKRILITYLNNGNLKSQVAKEYLFSRVVDDMIKDGKVVFQTTVNQFEKRVKFEDGSIVICKPFSSTDTGLRVTHVYIDDALLSIPNGHDIMMQCVSNLVIRHENDNYDVSDIHRAFTFKFDGVNVDLKNI